MRLSRIDSESIVEVEREQNGDESSHNCREKKTLVVGGWGKRRRGNLRSLVIGWSWERTSLSVLSARVELPDLLMATEEEEINDVGNDCRDFREEVLLAVQEEVLVLAAHDKG
jgi:hypothetical protein